MDFKRAVIVRLPTLALHPRPSASVGRRECRAGSRCDYNGVTGPFLSTFYRSATYFGSYYELVGLFLPRSIRSFARKVKQSDS